MVVPPWPCVLAGRPSHDNMSGFRPPGLGAKGSWRRQARGWLERAARSLGVHRMEVDYPPLLSSTTSFDLLQHVFEEHRVLVQGLRCDATPTVVKLFSKEYFELLKSDATLGPVLALGGKIIVVSQDKTVQVEE